MPPIFGIIHTEAFDADPSVRARMNGAANYVLPRRIETLETSCGLVAAAVIAGNPLHERNNIMATAGPWKVVADAVFYGRRGEQEKGAAEQILEAWLEWGEGCVEHLYGDFAFVVFNSETGEVFCGRDPLGVRPLFYTITNGHFIFGSELRYVLASFIHKPPLNPDYLLDTLVTGITPKELTPFSDICRLKPGHFLKISNGKVITKSYWVLYSDITIRLQHEEDYIRLFSEKLAEAVTSRCEGVEMLGSELSGGLDSSAICGIAARFARQEGIAFHAFSNVFPPGTNMKFKDEREYIDAMVQYHLMEWTGIDRTNYQIPVLLEKALMIQGCFVQQRFNIFGQAVYEAAGNKGVAVLLSGFGGDELVSARTAMPWNELIRKSEWKVVLDELFYKGTGPKSIYKSVKVASRFLGSLFYKPEFREGVFTKELIDKRFDSLPLQKDFAEKNKLRQRLEEKYRQPWQDELVQRQITKIMQDHLPQRMEYCYAAAAQYGLEYRYPLLDTELLGTCLSFPPWMKYHHGTDRYLFRQAIREVVPELIRQRKDKSGATIPHTLICFEEEKQLILESINDCSDSDQLKEIFDFSGFAPWYEKLTTSSIEDMNYLMPGAFYNYMMICLYLKESR